MQRIAGGAAVLPRVQNVHDTENAGSGQSLEHEEYGMQALRLRHPPNQTSYNRRADARLKKGDYDGAVADFDQALRLNLASLEAEAACSAGDTALAQGDSAGALSEYTRAIQLHPLCDAAFNRRSHAKRRQNDIDGALQDLNEALRINPNCPEHYYSRGQLKHLNGDVEDALGDFGHAVGLRRIAAAQREECEGSSGRTLTDVYSASSSAPFTNSQGTPAPSTQSSGASPTPAAPCMPAAAPSGLTVPRVQAMASDPSQVVTMSAQTALPAPRTRPIVLQQSRPPRI